MTENGVEERKFTINILMEADKSCRTMVSINIKFEISEDIYWFCPRWKARRGKRIENLNICGGDWT